jgi:hypothetical protein
MTAICSLLFMVLTYPAIADLQLNKFEMVFHLSLQQRDSVASSLGVRWIGLPVCVDTCCGGMVYCSFARCDGDTMCLVCLDRQGRVVRRTNAIHGLTGTLGGTFSVSLYRSRIFFTGTSAYSYFLSGDSLVLAENPWRKGAMRARYPNVPIEYCVGPFGDTIPSFRVQSHYILTISSDGLFQLFDSTGISLYFMRLPLPPGVTRFDNYITFWEMPIIGILGRELLLWDKDRLVVCDTSSHSLREEPLDSLFPRARYGDIWRQAEGTASGYFQGGNDLFVFLETDEGLFVFRRSYCQ